MKEEPLENVWYDLRSGQTAVFLADKRSLCDEAVRNKQKLPYIWMRQDGFVFATNTSGRLSESNTYETPNDVILGVELAYSVVYESKSSHVNCYIGQPCSQIKDAQAMARNVKVSSEALTPIKIVGFSPELPISDWAEYTLKGQLIV